MSLAIVNIVVDVAVGVCGVVLTRQRNASVGRRISGAVLGVGGFGMAAAWLSVLT